MAGQLWQWGGNSYGSLGDNTTVAKSSPVQNITGGTDWKQVSANQYNTIALKINGTLWTWGGNAYGQLGDNTIVHKSSPVQTLGFATNWNFVAASNNKGTTNVHMVAVKTDGTLWCWGNNSSGQLGDNTIVHRSSPVQTVAFGTNWISASAGQGFTAGIKTDGTLWTWGNNATWGALGDNTLVSKSSPIQTISGGNNWKQVACATLGIAAIKTDGTLWCWGYNGYGAVGDGTITSRSSPVQTITAGTNWSFVACGNYHTIARKTDGTLWSWGAGSLGQLGNNIGGFGSRRNSPVQTTTFDTNWNSVAGSFQSSVATKTDGTLWTWGANYQASLGDNTTVNKSSPVQTAMGGNRWSSIGFSAAIYENLPSALSITTQPANAYNAQKILNQPVVAVVDSSGAIVTTTQTVITAAIASGTPSLTGTTNILVSGGIAQFTDLTLSGLGSGSLIFTASGLTSAISNYVAVEQSSIAIVPKRSETSGRVPDATQLRNGELAVNLADKKGYVKNSSGQIVNVFTGLGADVITSGMIGENAINTRDIAPGAVSASELASGVIGGTNTQILYNQSGAIAGTAAFTLSTTSGVVTIAPQNAGYNALTLRSFTSQTADLLKVQNSAGTDIARVTSSGEWVGPLGSGVILSGYIASGQIGAFHLAAGTITSGYALITNTAGVLSWAAAGSNLTSGIVTSGFIGNAAVVSGSIASGSVGQFALSSGAVNSGQISQFAINNINIISGTVANDKLANSTITIAGSSTALGGSWAAAALTTSSGLLASTFYPSGALTIGIASGGIVAQLLASGSILSGAIASGQIGSFHIASGGILSGNIASGQIGVNHLGSGSVTSGAIASGQIGAFHISSGAVSSGELGNASVVSGSIASGQIFTFHIASGGILSGNIASGQIGQFHHASGSVVSGHIGNAAVVSGSIASGSISNFHISSGAITSGEIGNASVVSGSVASGQIGQFHHASGSVTSGHIGNNTVLSGSIASGQVFTLHIASGGLLSGAIGSGQVGTNHLSSGSVVSGTIASGQIGANHLSSGAVLSGSIASGQVGAYHFGASAITSGYALVTNAAGALSWAAAGGSLTSGQVTSGIIGNSAVASGSVASGQLGAVHIRDGSIASGELASGNVGVYHLGASSIASGKFLATDGSILFWQTVGGAYASGTTIAITNESTNATRYIAFTDNTAGAFTTAYIAATKLTFNPSTGDLTAGGNITANSDAKIKTNVSTISGALQKVTEMRGVYFNRIGTNIRNVGVIAQEVERVLPELVRESDGMKSVAYGNIVALLIEAIKEQNIRIEELEKRIL